MASTIDLNIGYIDLGLGREQNIRTFVVPFSPVSNTLLHLKCCCDFLIPYFKETNNKAIRYDTTVHLKANLFFVIMM